MTKEIIFKLFEGGLLPEYKSQQASCADCYARIAEPYITLPPNSRTLINLGFAVQLPEGYEMQIRPRSSLGFKDHIDVLFGTVDSDYRGEVKACVVNNSGHDYDLHNEDRICQIKICKSNQFNFKVVETLNETERGNGGFGSTGK